MSLGRIGVPFLIALGLLLLNLAPLAHAGVGLEYLGPNPLRPQPVNGQTNTLGAGAIVGNTGNEIATITFTLFADASFNNQFTYSVSNNNFSLSPGTRENFALIFTFNPNTISIKDYSASVKILASPASKSGTSGSASFDLAVAISADVLSSSYSGAQITLTTSTNILSITSSPTSVMTTQPVSSSTASTPQTNSLATNSSSIDPNLIIGVAIGAVAILVGFFLSSRRHRPATRGPSDGPSDKHEKAKTKLCTSCGVSIKLNDVFCDSCGAKQGD